MSRETTDYTSWGRTTRVRHSGVQHIFWRTDRLTGRDLDGTMLPYGRGRSYGDVCLNEDGHLVDTRNLDRFISFDPENGILRCETGVTFADILELIVPHGWFLPVVPGTKFITVGGAIANDIHGKNHHRAGTFGRYVRSLELLRSDGTYIVCSPSHEREWYRATIGGLGLTGLILSAEITLSRIQGPGMERTRMRFGSLEEYFDLAPEADKQYPYTVAWVDSLASGSRLGRGVLTCGTHTPKRSGRMRATRMKPAVGIPFLVPGRILNSMTVRGFNTLYYITKSKRPARRIVPYPSFFFPLDAIGHWNRVYGKRGFFQHQSVLPFDAAYYGVKELLTHISSSSQRSFLTVLKGFGSAYSPGLLSFPRPGMTLALDIPNNGEKTVSLLRRLDEIVVSHGGAVYPAKDTCMLPSTFRASFPEWKQFRKYTDPNFSSNFWRRVTGDERT